MLDTVKINHVQHISFTQSRLTDAVSVILSELLSYEHPSKQRGFLRIRGMESKKSAKPTFTGPIPVGAKTGRRIHTDPPPCFCQPGKAVPTISTRRGRTASTISRPFSAEEERAVARTPVEGMASLSMGYLK